MADISNLSFSTIPANRDDDVVFDEADLIDREGGASESEEEIGEEYEGVYSPPLTDTEEGPVVNEDDFYKLLVCVCVRARLRECAGGGGVSGGGGGGCGGGRWWGGWVRECGGV